MRISELSRRSGVSVATIKYYLRDGLLPAGHSTSTTQAEYDEQHLQRLRLIRAMADVAGLPLATIRRILAALDDQQLGIHQRLGLAHYALGGDGGAATADPGWRVVRTEVDTLLDELGWQVSERAPARDELTRAVLALRELDVPATVEDLRAYAAAAESVAAHELATVAAARESGENIEQLVRRTVIGAVLYAPVLLALRRLAEEHQSAQRFNSEEDNPTGRGRRKRGRQNLLVR